MMVNRTTTLRDQTPNHVARRVVEYPALDPNRVLEAVDGDELLRLAVAHPVVFDVVASNPDPRPNAPQGDCLVEVVGEDCIVVPRADGISVDPHFPIKGDVHAKGRALGHPLHWRTIEGLLLVRLSAP